MTHLRIKPQQSSYKKLSASILPFLVMGMCSIALSACGGSGSSSSSAGGSGAGGGDDDDGGTPPLANTIAPIISMNGFEDVEVVVDGLFFDPGASASDDVEGDISDHLVVTSTVDTAIVGTYTVTYDVSDESGNAATQLSRVVNVVPAEDKQFYGANGFTKIGSGEGGFPDIIDGGDRFGRDHAFAGDIDGDGIGDIILGARSDDDGATDAGAVYVIFLNADRSVKGQQKISATRSNFTGDLENGSFFGYGVAGIGDYDGDGIPDIAATADQSVYILHLNADGTVKSQTENTNISAQGLSAAGDLNGDGKIDLIAANPNIGAGQIQILFFNDDSRVITRDTVTISSTEGGFGVGLGADDSFGGRESAVLGDLDGDGNIEVAVGAFQSDEGLGAIWILSLDSESFAVIDKLKITAGEAGFDDVLSEDENENGTFGAQFGHALAAVGDLNGDGIPDLFSGANQHEEGHAYIFYLNADKTVKTYTRINEAEGGFDLTLSDIGRFSRSISSDADADGDGNLVINVGGDAGGTGAVYALNYQQCTFELEDGPNKFWQGGAVPFTNWSHADQLVTGPLSFEQCAAKTFEHDSNKVTFSGVDGRCIIRDDAATLSDSAEGSIAYTRVCP